MWNLQWGERTYIMGIINVTPDSFSGDGIFGGTEGAGHVGSRLKREGADVIDVGGESTRPGHVPVPPDEEERRVLPAISALKPIGLPLSVDTTKREVARKAVELGASIINDVSGLGDPEMADVAADSGAGLIIVHNRREEEGDLVTAIARHLDRRANLALSRGVRREAIVVDPGLGMGKGWRENFEIVRGLADLQVLGLPILIGPSRKGMIGRALGVGVHDRLEGTLALVTLCIAAGCDMVRVHDVRAMVRAARMTDALAR